MKNQSKLRKRTLSIILCMALILTGLIAPAKQAQAEGALVVETTSATKTIAGLGTSAIKDPTAPASDTDAWKGSYVYYGNYDADGDEIAEPVKYRVLDANTIDYSADGTTKTMLLDCDSILYRTPFDNDGTANADGKQVNDWSISDVKNGLNGDSFLNKDGVFTTIEKNAIAESNVATHPLTTDSENGVGIDSWTQGVFANYVALNGEQIFLLDAEDVSNGLYGYSMTDMSCENREKTGSSVFYWWLRSGSDLNNVFVGCVYGGGSINFEYAYNENTVTGAAVTGAAVSGAAVRGAGVSPAFNVNLSSVLFSSVISGTAGETGAEYKLTLLDRDMTITTTGDVTRNDKTVTIPYSISGNNSENAAQVSVLILDKEYTAGNTNGATVLDYQKLNVDSFSASGTGTYTLPDSLANARMGLDYYAYIVAEDINGEKETDYASEPKEITVVMNKVDMVAVPDIDTPVAEQPLKTEVSVSSTGVAEKATLTWKKNGTEATGNAQWKTTYQAYVTLTAADWYEFTDITGATLNGQPVDTENITLNNDGTLTIACGEYTTATRKTESAVAPEVPTQFANYYTADNVLSSTELSTTAKVTLEGSTQPNPVEMEVEWSIANEGGATYDATPTAANIFKWTVKESEYADYDKDVAVLEGTVTIQNKDYTPVTITGKDVTVTYNGEMDISQYFTIDEKAGAPTYELLDASTGNGTLDGTTLTMTTLGTFVIKVSTPINGVYHKGEHTITITVNKATPDVEALPTVADRAYHPTTVLVDADIIGGTVKDVSGNSLAGTWSWKEKNIVPSIGNDGYVAVFTPEDTARYENIEKTVSVKVSKATPYIKIVPTAAAITYGEALSASTFKDAVVWYSESDEKEIEGTFAWKEAATKPVVADSNKTEYALIFTPTDVDNYNTVETKITLTVNKLDNTPNMPKDTEIFVPYGTKTVGEVTLPEGWVWNAEDGEKAIEVGEDNKVTANAVYDGKDKGNYVIERVEFTITRQDCPHPTDKLGVRDIKEATCGEDGYTGDTFCKDCGKITKTGTVLPKTEKHTWNAGVVTKEATATEKGEKTYTCKVCKTTKKDEIAIITTPNTQTSVKKALPVGTKKISDDGKATYRVTTSDITKGTVTYVAPKNAKATKITISDTVVIDGVTYKVTAIEKNAFKKNKKMKSVTIGKNVRKIGKKAFYGCKKLKKLTIKSTKLTTKKVGSKAFGKTPKKMTVKVPKKKFKAYKKMLIKRGVNKKAKFKK